MKTKGLILLITVFILGSIMGCSNKNHKEKDMMEAIKEDFAKKSDTPIDEVNTTKLKRVGSKQMGYISILPEWHKFKDLDESVKDLQYSDPAATTIVSMNIFDKTGLTKEEARKFGAEDAARHVWTNLENHGATEVAGNTIKFQHYDAFQLYATYTGGAQLVAWLFEAEDKEIHYIAVESPTDEKFKLLTSTMRHPKNYSKRFYRTAVL